MNFVTKLESTMNQWFSGLPPLPTNARRWLGRNAWWIVMIFAILGVFTAIALIVLLSAVSNNLAYPAIYSVPSAPLYTLSFIVNLLVGVLVLVLQFMAISPLKRMSYKGWQLVFYSRVIGTAAIIAIHIFTIATGLFHPFDVIWSLVIAAIWFYLLFQVRNEFSTERGAAQ